MASTTTVLMFHINQSLPHRYKNNLFLVLFLLIPNQSNIFFSNLIQTDFYAARNKVKKLEMIDRSKKDYLYKKYIENWL